MSAAGLLRAAAMAAIAMTATLAAAGEPVGFGRPNAPATPAAQAETTTPQLASFLFESLYTEELIVVPEALKSRVGELSEMTVSLDPRMRVQGAFALALIGRGEVLTRTAFEPVAGSPGFEKANAAFLLCAVRQDCPRAVALLRKMAQNVDKDDKSSKKKGKKGRRVPNLEAVLLLSLIAQPNFARWVDSLDVTDPDQLAVLEVAKKRHAATFPAAR